MKTRTLYRPMGDKELQLIEQSGWTAFPPRLKWQPIFYPVLNEKYASEIAQMWNTRDEFSGYGMSPALKFRRTSSKPLR